MCLAARGGPYKDMYIQACLKLGINFSLTTKACSILMNETREQETSAVLRSAPGRCVRATKTCHAIHLGKTWPSFPWSSGAAALVTGTLGPTLSSRQRLPRRGKLRLSTLQTLFCQQQAHAFTPQLSLENKIKLFKIIHKSINKLGKIVDFLPQVSFLPVHN